MRSLNIIMTILITSVMFLSLIFSGCEATTDGDDPLADTLVVYDTVQVGDTITYQDTVTYVDTVTFVDTISFEDSVYILKHVGRLHFVETETSVRLYDRDQLITSYIFEDSLRKQVFFPLNLPSGRDFNRSYPVKRLPGEATDHPHHIGIWFTYGEVNDVDFWTTTWDNYDGINPRHGQIVHEDVNYEKVSGAEAVFRTSSSWQKVGDIELLAENSETRFTIKPNQLIIDRYTTLTAAEDILYKDSKEGMYAIRVASELQENQTGRYRNSDGLETEQNVFGTRAPWTILEGRMDSVNVSVLFMDHPGNVGYPAHWFARGYGLFGINPFGRAAFTNGAESLNYAMAKGESITFKYRIVLSEKQLSDPDINGLFDEFSTK